MVEVTSYGKSMYGGWYANTITDGKIGGVHFDKIYELRAWAKEHGIELKPYMRRDN